ncbi:putative phage protein [Candidatus Hepatincola sp. Pdp]
MLFNKENTIVNIRNTLQKNDFNLSNTPHLNLLIEAIVNAILDEIKNSLLTNTTKESD